MARARAVLSVLLRSALKPRPSIETHVLWIHQPAMPGPCQTITPVGQQDPVLGPVHIVHGITQGLCHMKLVEGDLLPGIRYRIQCGPDLSRPHVHGNALDACLLFL
jgi:hypothetical protein